MTGTMIGIIPGNITMSHVVYLSGTIQEKLKTDMKEAMKAKAQAKLDTVRFLQAEIKKVPELSAGLVSVVCLS